jgi:hypothetical protein
MNQPQNTHKPQQSKKLLDQYRDQIRIKQYSTRTEKTYIQWVREYILYHNKRHPKEMGTHEINQFITHLVVERKASASTHTVLAFGAREIKPSAPSSSSTATSSTSNSKAKPSNSSAPKKANAYPTSSPNKKPKPSSPK